MSRLAEWHGQWRTHWRNLLLILRVLKAEVNLVEEHAPAQAVDMDYAASAAQAVLHHDPRGARQILMMVLIFIVLAFLWMAFAQVEEQAHATGKVIPSGHLQVVQNLEGGIVAEINVHEGQTVEKDQTLLRIDDTQFASSYREQDKDRQYLRVKTARLQAEVDGKPFPAELDLHDIDADLLAREVGLYQSRQQELSAQLQVLTEQITQKEHEVSEIKAKVEQLSKSLALAQQELNMTQPLVKQGAISQVEVLRLQRQTNDLRGELEMSKVEVTRTTSALEEAQSKLVGRRLEFVAQAGQELNDARAELARTEEKRDALEDRVARTTVRSPVAGRVNRLLVNTIGGVVQPGMDLVEVVPTEANLLVEARVSPVDIAYLHPGQRAMIKVTAYDFTIYGGLQGELVHISPDSLLDKDGNSYYLVRVQTNQHFSGKQGQALDIIPGMTVEVDILTGSKSILSYVLKPIIKTRSRALTER